jgi:hypothetical protein
MRSRPRLLGERSACGIRFIDRALDVREVAVAGRDVQEAIDVSFAPLKCRYCNQSNKQRQPTARPWHPADRMGVQRAVGLPR